MLRLLTFRIFRRSIFVVAASIVPVAVAAECLAPPGSAEVAPAFQKTNFVFVGTLVEENAGQYELRFRVERLWKGPRTEEVRINVKGNIGVGSYIFRRGERYLPFATGPVAHERAAPVFEIERPCGSPTWALSLTADLDRLARSSQPR